jgi:hypothetical protein
VSDEQRADGAPALAPAPTTRRVAGIVAAVALAAMIVGGMAVLAVYTASSATRSDQRVADLTARLDALTESQKLIVAQLGATQTVPAAKAPSAAATVPDQTPHSVVPFKVTPAETNMGVNVAVVRFGKPGAQTDAGWGLTARYGNYLDGRAAFNVAASRGDVFQGTYYVNESTKTVDAKLLRGAAVTVHGWPGGGPAGASTSIAAGDLAAVLAADDAAGQRWRTAWFWVKISRTGDVLAAVETAPQ